MSLPDQTPRLPKWIFVAGDAALLALAWFIAKGQGHALTGYPLLAVVVCVGLAGILGVIPFLTDYAWTQDKALDERQRSLEALSRTVATAAEQISIAAAGLHEIADLAQKNLKHAEQLPQKLQDKIAEFKVQTASTRSEEIEELEREITALRASENDKLEAAADKVTKAVSDFSKAEASLQKQFSQATAALEKSTKAQSEALSTAKDSAIKAIEVAVASAVKAIGEVPVPVAPAPAAPVAIPEPPKSEAIPEPIVFAAEPPPVVITPDAEVAPVAPPTPSPFPEHTPAEPIPVHVAVAEPPPQIAHSEPAGEPVLDEPAAIAVAKAPRKRAPKKIEEPVPSLGLDEAGSSEFSQIEPEESALAETGETAISSDGATRLLVTAYIGIGNRLFVRGEGPGLSWDKGIPLQFVSIGKWRWESNDATATVKFRLFKNDADECAGLGERSVEPGSQIQLTASF